MATRTPGASALFTSGQARQGFSRDWGNYASSVTLPNASGNALSLARFTLEAGDRAYVTGTGLYVCTNAGTAGGSDAVWASQAGDVVGPASSTDNAVVRFDGTGGKTIQNSVAILTDTGELALGAGGLATPSLTMGTPTVGLYGVGGSESAYVASGTASLNFSSAGIRAIGGSAAAPSFSWMGGAGRSDAGFYQGSVDQIDVAVGATRMWSFGAAGADPTVLWGHRNTSRVGAFNNNGSIFFSGLITTANTPSVALDNNGVPFTGASGSTQVGVQLAHTVNQTGVNTGAFTALQISTTQTAVGTGLQLAIDFRTGGVSRGYVTSDARVIVSDGGISTPSLSFIGSPTEGFSYLGGVMYAAGGAYRWRFSSNVLQAFTTASSIQSGVFDGQLAILGAIGTGTTPSVVLSNTTSFTGGAATSQIGTQILNTVAQGGAAGAAFTALQISTTETSPGTGAQLAIDFRVGGVSQGHITSGALIRSAAGSVALPAWSFLGHETLGIMRPSASEMRMVQGGNSVFGFDANGPTLSFYQNNSIIVANSGNGALRIGGFFDSAAGGPIYVLNSQQFAASTAVQQHGFRIYSGVNQTSTASFASLYINQSLSFDGVTGVPVFGSGGGFLADFNSGAVRKFSVRDNGGIGQAHTNAVVLAAGNNNNITTVGTYGVARMTVSGLAPVLTGIAAPLDGRWLTLINVDNFNIDVTNLDGASTAANQIRTSTGATVTLTPNDTMQLWYDLDSAQWREINAAA